MTDREFVVLMLIGVFVVPLLIMAVGVIIGDRLERDDIALKSVKIGLILMMVNLIIFGIIAFTQPITHTGYASNPSSCPSCSAPQIVPLFYPNR